MVPVTADAPRICCADPTICRACGDGRRSSVLPAGMSTVRAAVPSTTGQFTPGGCYYTILLWEDASISTAAEYDVYHHGTEGRRRGGCCCCYCYWRIPVDSTAATKEGRTMNNDNDDESSRPSSPSRVDALLCFALAPSALHSISIVLLFAAEKPSYHSPSCGYWIESILQGSCRWEGKVCDRNPALLFWHAIVIVSNVSTGFVAILPQFTPCTPLILPSFSFSVINSGYNKQNGAVK